jgi:hypothetical protein
VRSTEILTLLLFFLFSFPIHFLLHLFAVPLSSSLHSLISYRSLSLFTSAFLFLFCPLPSVSPVLSYPPTISHPFPIPIPIPLPLPLPQQQGVECLPPPPLHTLYAQALLESRLQGPFTAQSDSHQVSPSHTHPPAHLSYHPEKG